ncbi:unnamed protein product [Candida verbasci]|uniref:Mitochondrial ribosomal protein MRP51 n=1 Tax=Candida verbasci TaxID=1227364 RepID=A0A9W4TTT4_9ASCO|nr:unnamed protein product [Candida verbasci]
MSRELFDLVKTSRLAQVAKPKPNSRIRTINSTIPTHQIIFTPVENASRSNYGLKSTLPNKIGVSHISYNDLDNKYSMPDVERNSGHHYNQLIFQELGLNIKNRYETPNPLFPNDKNKSLVGLTPWRSMIRLLGLPKNSKINDVLQLLKQNKSIYKQFQQFLISKYPKLILQKRDTIDYRDLTIAIKEFLIENENLIKNEVTLGNFMSTYSTYGNENIIQGTGGFTYNQKGRLNNTPNGIKHSIVAPGRLVNNKEAAIGGFISNVSDRSVALQLNYSRNQPGKHTRQFKMPYKINEVDLSDDGTVRIFSEGIKLGKWMETDDRFTPTRNDFDISNSYREERQKKESESLEQLLNLILPGKK